MSIQQLPMAITGTGDPLSEEDEQAHKPKHVTAKLTGYMESPQWL
jgi:hypothetical protein